MDDGYVGMLFSFHVFVNMNFCNVLLYFLPPRWRIGRAFPSHAGYLGSIPSRDRPKSLKQVVTVLLPNTRQ